MSEKSEPQIDGDFAGLSRLENGELTTGDVEQIASYDPRYKKAKEAKINPLPGLPTTKEFLKELNCRIDAENDGNSD